MKTQPYFKVNWKAINGAIPDNLKELRQAQKELSNEIQKRVDNFYKLKKQKEFEENVRHLKSLPAGTKLTYIGWSDKIKFGAIGEKVSNAIKYIHVKFGDTTWKVPYERILDRELTEQEKRDRLISRKLTQIANSVFSK